MSLLMKHIKNTLVFIAIITVVASGVAAAAGDEAGGSGVEKELRYAEKLVRDGMYDVARGELARFTGQDTPPGIRQQAFLLLGDIETSGSDYARARKMYESALEAAPKGADACRALAKAGHAAFMLKDYRGAAAALAKLPEIFPDCALVCPAMLEVGRARFESGDYEEAVRELERTRSACGVDEKDPEVLFWLGRAQSRLDRDRGRQTFEAVVKSYAGTPAAFGASLELAAGLEKQGNRDGAAALLKQALEYKGMDRGARAVGLDRYARLLAANGMAEEAGRAFSECFELSADSTLCERCNLSGQEAFLSAGKDREADALAQKLLSGAYSGPAKEASLLTRAACARNKGDLAGSLSFLIRVSRTIATDSLYCVARIEEAQARKKTSDLSGAEAAYLDALKHSCPESLRPGVLLGLADLYGSSLGKPEMASLYDGLIVEQYPGTEEAASAVGRLADAAEKRGDFGEASRLLENLAKDFPLSDRADESRRRAAALRELFPPSLRVDDLRKLNSVVSSAAEGSLDGEKTLEQAAQVLRADFRAFDQAATLLEQALLSAPAERKHIPLMALGEVLLLQARKADYLGKPDEATRQRSSGLRYFRDLVSQYPDSPFADDAKFELIRAELERLESPQREKRAVALYTEFLQTYPETNRFDEGLLLRAEAEAALSEDPGDEYAADALSTFDRIVTDFSRSPFVAEALFRKGKMLCQQGDAGACESDLEAVVDRYPSSSSAAEAAYELGELKLARRETDRAVSLYTTAFEKAETRSLRERALARRGDSYLVAGDLSRAIGEYEYVLGHDPRGPFADDLLAKVAQAYLSRGMVAEASRPLGRLQQEFPRSTLLPGLLMKKAQAEERAGDFAAARSTYDEIGRKFAPAGSDTNFVMGLARASFNSNDFTMSLSAYERLLKMDTSAELRREAGRGAVLSLAKQGEESKLKKRLSWYLENFPEDSSVVQDVALERGLNLYQSGQYEDAYSALSSAEGSLPASGRMNALVTMGLAKLRTGDFAASAEAFRTAVEVEQGASRQDTSLAYTARFKLGSALFAMSDFSQASAAYLEAARFCRDSSQCCEAWYNSGLCLEKAEDWRGAADLYLRVAGGCSGKLGKDAAFKAGYSRLNGGDSREAIVLLGKALDVSDESEKPEVQYWIGEAYAAAGDMERAAAEFLKVPYLYGEGTLWAVTARYKAGQAFEAAGNNEAAVRQYRAIIQREGEQSEWGSMAKERLLLLSK